MNPYNIIKNPLATEKAVRIMESENKLVFIVDRKANKLEIREAIETLFNVKVDNVNSLILKNGRKKVYATLNKDYKALDIATKLGLM
nr:50S ribosomal protein L23 [Candidatus Woesearchaeota archaeon]